MRELGKCAGGYPYVKYAGHARVSAIVVTPVTIASDCYFELIDSATNTDSTSLDSTSPRNLSERGIACRKPFSARIHADIGTQVFNFDTPLEFDSGVQIGYAENCRVSVYVK